ncbi:MAG: 2Fe-2S iron-sulfur cluster-binding protein [Pseudorhodoplanes sp.]|uniref:PDR/VanB family oxidoreductase n=1 Tax=Pseudorhodoplanes sp. TaxID=1934341 RepID=UPI003D0B81D9
MTKLAPYDVNDAIELRLNTIGFVARGINTYEFVRPNGGALPTATAGAHVDLHLPNGLIRQYSLTRASRAPCSYIIGVKRDLASRGGSRFIFDELKVGDELRIGAPRNNFPLHEGNSPAILIAGGIGITPMLAMAETLSTQRRPFELHYACRDREEAAFLDELAVLGNWRLHVDREAGGILEVPDIVARAPGDAHLYCCGPKPMLEVFELATQQLPVEQVHVEYFTPKHEAATQGSYVVELARSAKTVLIPSGRTILEVLRAEGLNIPTSCEHGICGTCETAVIAGIPDHRDAILTESEKAANKSMMICCSGSKSDRLVLDL